MYLAHGGTHTNNSTVPPGLDPFTPSLNNPQFEYTMQAFAPTHRIDSPIGPISSNMLEAQHATYDENLYRDFAGHLQYTPRSFSSLDSDGEHDSPSPKKSSAKRRPRPNNDKRRAQNRANQRAFRERRSVYIRTLESHHHYLEQLTESQQAEINHLRQVIWQLNSTQGSPDKFSVEFIHHPTQHASEHHNLVPQLQQLPPSIQVSNGILAPVSLPTVIYSQEINQQPNALQLAGVHTSAPVFASSPVQDCTASPHIMANSGANLPSTPSYHLDEQNLGNTSLFNI